MDEEGSEEKGGCAALNWRLGFVAVAANYDQCYDLEDDDWNLAGEGAP